MGKGAHREHERVVLPDGTWLLLYSDGTGGFKLGGYEREVTVTQVESRYTGDTPGFSVRGTVKAWAAEPREVTPRGSDYVCVRRDELEKLRATSGEN